MWASLPSPESQTTFQGGAVDQDQVNAYVGQNCADAQANAGIGNFAPCAQLTSATPQAFQSGPEYSFDPIFLAYGVVGDQGISVAEPAGGFARFTVEAELETGLDQPRIRHRRPVLELEDLPRQFF